MAIRVALHHRTAYQYDRYVTLSPQVVRLRPAPHCRTPVVSYSLHVEPEQHFLNWQQDPHGNFLARLVFPNPTRSLAFEVDLVAELTVINPFDFFLEPEVYDWPFPYADWLETELRPYLQTLPVGPRMKDFLATLPRGKMRTVDYLVELNRRVHERVGYVIRLEPGVQTCEQTLTLGTGSCRDSAWLLVQVLRNLGLAARFVSGYLIQLKPDVKPLEGPAGAGEDFTDLHAWTEVYLPGAGWVGLDPTSGLLAAEGHLPLAATPDPTSAAPITGGVDPCDSEFEFAMTVTRVHEDPRVTKPYTDEQWSRIEALGHQIDEVLTAGDARVTMGGEPTFVSIDDMDAPEWNTAAFGDKKRRMAGELFRRLADRFAPGPLLHYGQGKWYPGESLPRWALSCYWRKDGQPIWHDLSLYSADDATERYGEREARAFVTALARRLGVDANHAAPAYEDAWYYLWKERRLPANVDPLQSNLANAEDRARLARVFEQGLKAVVGFALPLRPKAGWVGQPEWESGAWFFRQEHMYLIPGDSAMGFRLPLDSLAWTEDPEAAHIYEQDPFAHRGPLPAYGRGSGDGFGAGGSGGAGGAAGQAGANGAGGSSRAGGDGNGRFGASVPGAEWFDPSAPSDRLGIAAFGGGRAELAARERRLVHQVAGVANALDEEHALWGDSTELLNPLAEPADARRPDSARRAAAERAIPGQPVRHLVRTALCVEPRDGRLHIFMPPVGQLEEYLALIAAVEQTAAALGLPVRIEGYAPPYDYRVQHFKVTPDPGVIEVNAQPAASWAELVENTTVLYEEARQSRLGAEKFMLDGRHAGTGGGNHVVIGGPRPVDSPFLRRPDLLRSLVTLWNNRPSLSYLFSGLFIGPTSQAPRVDEARHESIYELETAFAQLPKDGSAAPWLVDRVLRNLLVDVTGNTHRAEFCIDKLFSPDSASGRLGLVEFRGFEMPPHARMSLTQQLLLRALLARFWREPYSKPLVRWGTSLHDRFLLPHFVAQDFAEVLGELTDAGFPFEQDWFAPHFEFRFPKLGHVTHQGVDFELRQAIEPWNVLGEEPGGGGTVRFVDSSVERVQVKIRGMTSSRFIVACNGRRVPLHSTGTPGEFVAGVRFRAWQPASCLHPTIGVHAPLVFDLIDTWNERSVGGCTWHVAHPGGRSFETFPVNAYEAESRRVARFFPTGHTAGQIRPIPVAEHNGDFPFTLDLRRPIELATLNE